MKRKIMEKLRSWKEQLKRKPLILMGARQVGKTFVLKKFGELEYKNTIYLNFENNPRLCKLFDASLDPEMILKALTIEMDKVLIRTSPMNLRKDGNILNCPLYLIEKLRSFLK